MAVASPNIRSSDGPRSPQVCRPTRMTRDDVPHGGHNDLSESAPHPDGAPSRTPLRVTPGTAHPLSSTTHRSAQNGAMTRNSQPRLVPPEGTRTATEWKTPPSHWPRTATLALPPLTSKDGSLEVPLSNGVAADDGASGNAEATSAAATRARSASKASLGPRRIAMARARRAALRALEMEAWVREVNGAHLPLANQDEWV
eukprot:scaffold7460_cov33-Tisochrysis_lutea.AAC.3